MAILTSIFKKDDPFNVWMKAAAPIAVLILWPLLILLQQFNTSLREETTSSAPAEVVASEEADDPGLSGLVIRSKVIVKTTYLRLNEMDPSGRGPRKPFGETDKPTDYPHISKNQADKQMKRLDEYAVSRTDRFRAAIVAGELLGPKEAHERLEKLRGEVTVGGDLSKDIDWVSGWYERAAKGRFDPLPQDVQDALVSRHGWFAKLAISHQKAAGDPVRWEVVSGASGLEAFRAIRGCWTIAVLGLGVIVAIITFVKIRGFEPAMVETTIERSVYAEMFAIFLLGFLITDAFDIFVLDQKGAWSVFMGQALIWSASAAFLWPLLRGVTWNELRIDLGLTSGQGISKEIGAGIIGFLVGLPLSVLYRIVLGAIQTLNDDGGSAAEEGIKYPVFESPMGHSWVLVIIGVISSCIWAPFFEETFFRGALHRYLPSRLGIMGRVAITALIFGSIHPYDVSGIIDVALAGLIFGLLREWRGSLIAGMVAHCLHNLTIDVGQVVPLYLLQ